MGLLFLSLACAFCSGNLLPYCRFDLTITTTTTSPFVVAKTALIHVDNPLMLPHADGIGIAAVFICHTVLEQQTAEFTSADALISRQRIPRFSCSANPKLGPRDPCLLRENAAVALINGARVANQVALLRQLQAWLPQCGKNYDCTTTVASYAEKTQIFAEQLAQQCGDTRCLSYMQQVDDEAVRHVMLKGTRESVEKERVRYIADLFNRAVRVAASNVSSEDAASVTYAYDVSELANRSVIQPDNLGPQSLALLRELHYATESPDTILRKHLYFYVLSQWIVRLRHMRDTCATTADCNATTAISAAISVYRSALQQSLRVFPVGVAVTGIVMCATVIVSGLCGFIVVATRALIGERTLVSTLLLVGYLYLWMLSGLVVSAGFRTAFWTCGLIGYLQAPGSVVTQVNLFLYDQIAQLLLSLCVVALLYLWLRTYCGDRKDILRKYVICLLCFSATLTISVVCLSVMEAQNLSLSAALNSTYWTVDVANIVVSLSQVAVSALLCWVVFAVWKGVDDASSSSARKSIAVVFALSVTLLVVFSARVVLVMLQNFAFSWMVMPQAVYLTLAVLVPDAVAAALLLIVVGLRIINRLSQTSQEKRRSYRSFVLYNNDDDKETLLVPRRYSDM